MPLVNEFRSGDGLYTNKQLIKLYDSACVNPILVAEQIKTGDGIFASLGSLISPALKLVSANKDLIKSGIQSAGSVIQAGKNINDAVNSTRKVDTEINYLKKLKNHIDLLNKEASSSPTNTNSSLSDAQQKALKETVQNMPTNKKPHGKGLRVY